MARQARCNGLFLKIRGAKENNLKNINVDIPLGKFVCITGVSGSGKSSLINEVLYKRVANYLYKSKDKPGLCKEIKGLENIKPLFIKETKGESMPSRHVFSITIIAMCWLYVSVPVGIIMLLLVAIMSASRVLAGVHFVRDVVAGFAVGIICGIAGLWLI